MKTNVEQLETQMCNNYERNLLYDKYKDVIKLNNSLTRSLVSFQSNKKVPFYNWFKYKEGFSTGLIRYIIDTFFKKTGKLLDPFAGSGTALFAAREMGWDVTGIELLPVGKSIIQSRLAVDEVTPKEIDIAINQFWNDIDHIDRSANSIKHIPITENAFPEKTEELLNSYLSYCNTIESKPLKRLMTFAAFCILEDISYTRKDGQYLRWDYRAKNRKVKSSFKKNKIYSFREALTEKIAQMKSDMEPELTLPLGEKQKKGTIELKDGSLFEIMPCLEDSEYDLIFTSPPYCNRYDYTRTYALELVFLNLNNEEVKNLRQQMLSCTVENREKIDDLKDTYEKLKRKEDFEKIIDVYESCNAMTEINNVLEKLNQEKKLNNSNIPRMVKNYFLEMCISIFEMHRVLKKQGLVILVNDNVRYHGEDIPVDLILSDFADSFGFKVEKIWVLPVSKGNSSQQMGKFGKNSLRKCVYVWRKK